MLRVVSLGKSYSNMTIKIEKPGLADRILKLFGKTRQVVVPEDPYKHGPHTYIHAKRESFWKALFRERKSGRDNY